MRNSVGLVFGAALACVAGTPISAQAQVPSATASLAVDEGQFIDINGVEQWTTVRSANQNNPVLLMLHGGPGFPLSFMAPLFAEWERDFTVVQWDQPATGGTHLKNMGKDVGPLTIERYVRDGITVAEWAKHRFGGRKIVLLGTSWGSLLGLEMIKQRPDIFMAYVGTAQPVGPEGAKVGYEMALEAARKRGDAAGTDALMRVGPPPYTKFEDFMVRQQYSNAPGLPPTPQEAAAVAELMNIFAKPDPTAKYNAPLTTPPGYDGGLMAAQQATWRQTWSWEALRLGTKFEVPMFIFQGDVDVNTPTPVARAWFDRVQAPKKVFATVPGAGHSVILFHRELLALMRKHVLPGIGEKPAR